jgi:hypothetical protein
MVGDQTKLKRHVFGISILFFLELFGLIFIGIGVGFVSRTKIDPTWIRTQGEVVDIVEMPGSRRGPSYYPVLKYLVNGQSYQFRREWSSSGYPVLGSKEEIAYNQNRPNQAKAVESIGGWIFLLLFPSIGAVMVIMAPILFIRSSKRSQVIKNLIQIGNQVSGVIARVKSVGGPKGINSYKIIVSATDNTGVTKEYMSDRVGSYADLAVIDFHKNSIPAGVYINPTNPQQYYVDIDSMPDLTSLSRDAFMQLAKR